MKTRPLILGAACLVASGFLTLLHAEAPSWNPAACRQNAMVLYARVVDSSGHEISAPGSLLAAFEGESVAGVTPVMKGPGGNFLYQLKVGSDAKESVMGFKVYDAGTDRILSLEKGPDFIAGSLAGTLLDPVVLVAKP